MPCEYHRMPCKTYEQEGKAKNRYLERSTFSARWGWLLIGIGSWDQLFAIYANCSRAGSSVIQTHRQQTQIMWGFVILFEVCLMYIYIYIANAIKLLPSESQHIIIHTEVLLGYSRRPRSMAIQKNTLLVFNFKYCFYF